VTLIEKFFKRNLAVTLTLVFLAAIVPATVLGNPNLEPGEIFEVSFRGDSKIFGDGIDLKLLVERGPEGSSANRILSFRFNQKVYGAFEIRDYAAHSNIPAQFSIGSAMTGVGFSKVEGNDLFRIPRPRFLLIDWTSYTIYLSRSILNIPEPLGMPLTVTKLSPVQQRIEAERVLTSVAEWAPNGYNAFDGVEIKGYLSSASSSWNISSMVSKAIEARNRQDWFDPKTVYEMACKIRIEGKVNNF
jgi:hypothetical protein